jgi:hypothetical protein
MSASLDSEGLSGEVGETVRFASCQRRSPLVQVAGWSVVGSVIVGSVLSASGAIAQIQALPPPPSIPNVVPSGGINGLPTFTPIPAPQGGQPIVVPTGSPTGSYPSVNPAGMTVPHGGYAPPASYAPLPQPATQPQTAYTVLINGDSPYLLQLVQQIEPIATVQDYKGQRVIQAGVFGLEQDARQRVSILQQQGVNAQVVPVALGNQTPMALRTVAPAPVSQPRTSHFEVVVPTGTENFGIVTNKLMSMGVKPEAIQAKQVPLGPHVSVGPFNEVDEARRVSSYLRTGGLDARVYYAK